VKAELSQHWEKIRKKTSGVNAPRIDRGKISGAFQFNASSTASISGKGGPRANARTTNQETMLDEEGVAMHN